MPSKTFEVFFPGTKCCYSSIFYETIAALGAWKKTPNVSLGMDIFIGLVSKLLKMAINASLYSQIFLFVLHEFSITRSLHSLTNILLTNLWDSYDSIHVAVH